MLQRRCDGPLQARLDLRRRNGLLQKLRRGNGKAAAFAAAQQIDPPKGHLAALRLADRGLRFIAARLAQGVSLIVLFILALRPMLAAAQTVFYRK